MRGSFRKSIFASKSLGETKKARYSVTIANG